MFSGHVD